MSAPEMRKSSDAEEVARQKVWEEEQQRRLAHKRVIRRSVGPGPITSTSSSASSSLSASSSGSSSSTNNQPKYPQECPLPAGGLSSNSDATEGEQEEEEEEQEEEGDDQELEEETEELDVDISDIDEELERALANHLASPSSQQTRDATPTASSSASSSSSSSSSSMPHLSRQRSKSTHADLSPVSSATLSNNPLIPGASSSSSSSSSSYLSSTSSFSSSEQHRNSSISSTTVSLALSLFCFPLHLFFSHLYYTDVGSLCFVLATYLFALRSQHLLASLCGAFAILFRQPNVVWVGFVAAEALLHLAQLDYRQTHKPTRLVSASTAYSSLWQEICALVTFLSDLPRLFRGVIRPFAPYLLLMLGFLAFGVYNGGLAVGDKEAHAVALHIPQVFYFVLFCMLALLPEALAQSRRTSSLLSELYQQVRRSPLLQVSLLLLGVLAALAVHYLTYEHAYLLADNRHLPFYVWRRCFRGYPLNLRYALVPVYVLGVALLSALLQRSTRRGGAGRSALWVLLFWLATAAVLVPASLLEFRYFTVPFFLIILQLTAPTRRALLCRTLAYATMSALSVAVFLIPRADGERFMW